MLKTCPKTHISFIQIDCEQKPEKLCVLFHGYGANAVNFAELADIFTEKEAMRSVSFVVANGLKPFEMEPGSGGRQWFSLQDRSEDVMLRGLRGIEADIEKFIAARLFDYGLEHKDLVIGGFSQGAMLSLHVGLRMKRPPAKICCFSGALIGGDKLTDDVDAATLSETSIVFMHGRDDDVVPVEASIEAHKICQKLGLRAEIFVEDGVQHNISMQAVNYCVKFLESAQ